MSAHCTTSVTFSDLKPEICSIKRSYTADNEIYLTITWRNEDDVSDLTVFLGLEEAVTFVQDLSAVVFAAKAGIVTDDTAY